MSEQELKGKIGIVTGGSSGIGFQIANVLAEAGAIVYNISRTGKPKEGYGESAEGVIHIRGDIGDTEAMKTLLTEIAGKNGGAIDFLVNNAGASFKCRAEEFPEEQFDRVMNINVKYVFSMSQLAYPYLKKAKDKGRIINITSMSAHLGFSQVVPYCASKGAVLAMTRGLAVEWAEDNICVNSIAPGWFRSELLKDVLDPEREKKILARMPFHAYGDTRDLGAMARFLIGPGASYITGQDFAVDGGALAFGY
ncbi:MAG: SDR family oxidoreductase [Lachnospiraceae bacterium]|nr:SDR family oxidoreductase [Lachnospiraceae bacterium]